MVPHLVFNQKGDVEQQALVSLAAEKVTNSPIVGGEDIIEIFSYGCHYCEVNEENVDALEKRMPAGKKLVRIHFNLDGGADWRATHRYLLPCRSWALKRRIAKALTTRL